MMTEKDRKLIAEAEAMSYSECGAVADLAKMADTEEAAAVLKEIAVSLYHTEEYHAGLA